MPNYTVKITKRTTLLTISNEYQASNYYLIHGRIYNAARTQYRKFKFVLWIDRACDLWDSELEQDIPLETAIDIGIDSMLGLIRDYDNVTEFYQACNDSIRHWNETV